MILSNHATRMIKLYGETGQCGWHSVSTASVIGVNEDAIGSEDSEGGKGGVSLLTCR